MRHAPARNANPIIFVADTDFDMLLGLACRQTSSAAELLRRELDRAIILDDTEPAPPYVRLNARVAYLELPAGRIHTVRLVRPDAAEMEEAALSILTTAGAALLGLSAGDSFSVTMDDGSEHVLVVIDVENP
jgi:regulator of nucleoside diphosphate kinase